MGATGHNNKEQQTAADPEIFVVCVCGGGGVQILDCFCFSHHILKRGEGISTNILSWPFQVLKILQVSIMAPGDRVIFQGGGGGREGSRPYVPVWICPMSKHF